MNIVFRVADPGRIDDLLDTRKLTGLVVFHSRLGKQNSFKTLIYKDETSKLKNTHIKLQILTSVARFKQLNIYTVHIIQRMPCLLW